MLTQIFHECIKFLLHDILPYERSYSPNQLPPTHPHSARPQVLEQSENIMKQIPANIDYDATARILSVDPSPLTVVLLQEIERYNELLNLIRQQLNELRRGIQGLVVMSTDLEAVFSCIFESRVPPMWEKVGCSKPRETNFV